MTETGDQNTKPRSNPWTSPFQWALTVLIAAGATYWFLAGNKSSDGPTQAQVDACRAGIRVHANIPQTVQFAFLGYSWNRHESDNLLRIRNDFSAKNAFGLELSYTGLCIFRPKGMEVLVMTK